MTICHSSIVNGKNLRRVVGPGRHGRAWHFGEIGGALNEEVLLGTIVNLYYCCDDTSRRRIKPSILFDASGDDT
jgi:hypothetical protein